MKLKEVLLLEQMGFYKFLELICVNCCLDILGETVPGLWCCNIYLCVFFKVHDLHQIAVCVCVCVCGGVPVSACIYRGVCVGARV